MKKLFFICFFFITIFYVVPQDAEKIFTTANKNYKEKKYDDAVKNYLQLLDMDYDNFEVNYNLGCCFYKLNQPGCARYYFERALFYMPYNEDLFNSLGVTYHRIFNNPLFGEQEIMNTRIIFFIPLPILAVLLTFIFISFIITIIIFLRNRKKGFLVIATICICLSIVFTSFFAAQYNEFNKKIAIVTEEKANVYLQPYSDTIITTIKEGTKAKVIDSVEEYIKINFDDGTVGWVKVCNVITNHKN